MLIKDIFRLMFAFSEQDATRYEARRWFRTPSPFTSDGGEPSGAADASQDEVDAADDIANADHSLEDKIIRSAKEWAERLDLAVGQAFDPLHHVPPRMPYDVFAIAAHLLEQGGIYHHIQPSREPVGKGGHLSAARSLQISAEDREKVSVAAEAWRSLPRLDDTAASFAQHLLGDDIWPDIEPLFESWWIVFAAHEHVDIRDRPVAGDEPETPSWWRHVWRLLAIADEAAAGTGFVFDVDELGLYLRGEKTEITWFEAEVMLEHMIKASARTEFDDERAEFKDVNSLSVARSSMLNVLPKVRTPSVGCTLRSISHHLALLPPLGVVKGQWTPNYRRRAPESSHRKGLMNLLLVPMPFSLGARSFSPAFVETVETSTDGTVEQPKIGYFDVDQEWLRTGKGTEAIGAFITRLIEAAKCHASELHGVVLPELALDYPHFAALKAILRDCCEGIEILVAGTSSDRDKNKGNFVAATTFRDATAGQTSGRETVREKHHRWKLDAAQLRDYGLQGVLSPEQAWWENIPLQSRQVDFTVMRKDSVFAAMICEDLARVDPCQQMIRAVGPNLVIALLMDAPQIEARWPARYATVLAEDPGCAVLTLTSRGLMNLQDRLGTHRSQGNDRIIALWRDDASSRPVTLECPYDAQGVLLTIVESSSADVSLDGRVDGKAKAWRHAGHLPVRIDDVKAQYAKVLGRENLLSF
ncbi:hypothetical protein [Qipengyuania flava]|uniref:hypothetical protein n=1 Tax=Qipengyuania flava TaxID=192812 RepID=UPI001CD3FE7B|nr:hypothetical protein [Qipengyuania flava]MCA0891265.1 hypothetical protein [Qipengyuania flava]